MVVVVVSFFCFLCRGGANRGKQSKRPRVVLVLVAVLSREGCCCFFFQEAKSNNVATQSKRRAMERRVGVVVAAFDSLEGCCCKATSKTRKSLHQEEENERGNQAEKNRSKKSAEVSATTRMRWTYSQACYEREGGVQRVVAG